jgi:hypothetical protein
VEIIVVLSQFQKPQSFLIKSLVRQRSFILQSECLTTKNRFPKAIDSKVAADTSAGQRQMHANSRQIMAGIAVQSSHSPASHSRSHHEIATSHLVRQGRRALGAKIRHGRA